MRIPPKQANNQHGRRSRARARGKTSQKNRCSPSARRSPRTTVQFLVHQAVAPYVATPHCTSISGCHTTTASTRSSLAWGTHIYFPHTKNCWVENVFTLFFFSKNGSHTNGFFKNGFSPVLFYIFRSLFKSNELWLRPASNPPRIVANFMRMTIP